MTKTDNHNVGAKLALRRYFLQKYHAEKSPATLDVLDCCQGSGLLWRELKKQFTCDSYLGVDLKPQKGRLKIDSVRILDQSGWKFNCIDVDTYGAPWGHWFALLRHAPRKSLTVFLTIGLSGILPRHVTREEAQAVGVPGSMLSKIPAMLKARLAVLSLPACLAAAAPKFDLTEVMEADNPGGHARYVGIRLSSLVNP